MTTLGSLRTPRLFVGPVLVGSRFAVDDRPPSQAFAVTVTLHALLKHFIKSGASTVHTRPTVFGGRVPESRC